jgi:glycosyltransferase involved in cell wall biosynthesis
MSKITAVIIVKNGENLIADCIDSVSFCDEILVIDNQSEDRTIEVAKRMNAKVYEYETKDFAELRNFGLTKAKSDWILYIDVDERVSEDLGRNIKDTILRKDSQFSAYRLQRKNYYFKNVEWPHVEKIIRLFNKKSLKGWEGKLHESPVIDGEIGDLDGYLLHYTHRDLASMLKKTIEWSRTEADLRFNANHPKMSWWRFPRVMISAFFNSYIKQEGYKAGTAGLVESIYQSFSMFITYARLWEIQNEANRENKN